MCRKTLNKLIAPRIKKVLYSLVVLFVLLAVRLFCVQLGAAKPLSKLASDQYKTFSRLLPRRGMIYDRNLRELAVSINLDSVFIDPALVEDRHSAANKLSAVLEEDPEDILKKLDNKKRFAWLARRIETQAVNDIKRLSIKGVGFTKEPKRAYPNDALASHVLGFVGLDDEGLEGIELLYNQYLTGTVGWIYSIRDAKKREVPGYEYREISPADGNDVVLTIDSVVQAFAEKELERSFKKYNAKGGMIVVMEPYTGDILALANRPTFNPNKIGDYPVEARRNRVVCDFFEPGSSFKIVTATAVIEEDVMGMDDELYCENGEFKWSMHTYHDHKPYEWLKFRDIIKYSSNIGTMKSALKVGDRRLYRYIKRFGFGNKTDIDLPGEVRGIIRPTNEWSKLSLCSISMGQEVTVTALQLACALSSVANGGVYVKPRIVTRVQDKTGYVIEKFEPRKLHRVMSGETSEKMREILRGVVAEGTGMRAEVKGYSPAGKTGTAQKVEEDGRYSHRKFMSSFIGFLPYNDPKFVVVVLMDEPRPIYYGGTVCAPVFKEVAEQLMRYYKIEPTS